MYLITHRLSVSTRPYWMSYPHLKIRVMRVFCRKAFFKHQPSLANHRTKRRVRELKSLGV